MYRSGICDGTCWIEFGFTLSLKLLNMRMSPLVHPYEWGKGAECILECISERVRSYWRGALERWSTEEFSTIGVVLKYLLL